MPKFNRSTESALDKTINQIITRTAHEVVHAVRHSIAEEVARLVGGTIARSDKFISSVVRKRARVLCPVPGCNEPTGGPRWGWFCAEHKDLPEEEKLKHRAERKAAARTNRTVRNNGKARRLLNCPYPGCSKPGKGPRYGWFCEEHRTLPKEERDRIRSEQRAHAPAAKGKKTLKNPSKAKQRKTSKKRRSNKK